MDIFEEQKKHNEEIRKAYAFMKYTENIDTNNILGKIIHNEATSKWLNTISKGIKLITDSENKDIKKYDKMVSCETIMKKKTTKRICSQGSVYKIIYTFPWE